MTTSLQSCDSEAAAAGGGVTVEERYAGLRERLITDGRDEIVLDFDEFGIFLLGGLPRSASRDRTWWANSDGDPAHAHVHAWLDAGYCIDFVDLEGRSVRFRRREAGDVRRPRAL